MNCCECGLLVDTREVENGGEPEGCELTDGRWVCSNKCWEIAVREQMLNLNDIKFLQRFQQYLDEYEKENTA